MLGREKLDDILEGFDCACSSVEALVASLDTVMASEDIPRMMPLIELLDTQSLLVYHDYLMISVEEAESGASLDRPFA
jgi:hypothetical protein